MMTEIALHQNAIANALQDILDKPVASTGEATNAALEVFTVAASIKSTLDALQKKAKEVLEDVMLETGEIKWESELATAIRVETAGAVTYDRKALDVLCDADQYIAEKIGKYRKVGEGNVTIRITPKKG